MNKFDRILWRINGVLFLAILLIGVFQLAWILIAPPFPRPSRADNAAVFPSGAQTNEKEIFRLGWPTRITGTSVFRMPLHGEVPPSGSSFKSSGGRNWLRNYLFIDYSDLSSWWLFDGFKQHIIKEHDIREEGEADRKRVVGTILEVVARDDASDRDLTADSPVTALLAQADGKKPIEILSACDRIVSVDQVPNNEVLIVYQRGAITTAALFSTQTGAKIKEATVASKNKK